jgi:hypothetical protein
LPHALQTIGTQDVFINGILHLRGIRVHQQGAPAPEDKIRLRWIGHAVVHLGLQAGIIITATALSDLDHQFREDLVIRPDTAGRAHRVDLQLRGSLVRPIFMPVKCLGGILIQDQVSGLGGVAPLGGGKPLVEFLLAVPGLIINLPAVGGQSPFRNQLPQPLRGVEHFEKSRLLVLLGPMPDQGFHGKIAHIPGIDTPAAEGLDDGQAVVVAVVRHQVIVRGHQGAQIIPEIEVHRGAIFQGPDAHLEEMIGGLGGFLGQELHQVRRDFPLGQHAGSPRGEAQEVGNAPLINGQKGFKERGHEDGPPGVGFGGCKNLPGVRFFGDPLPGLGIEVSQGAAQCSVSADGLAELVGQLAEQALLFQVAPGAGNLLPQDLKVGELLEEGQDVRKGFVEGPEVSIGRLYEPAVQAVQQGVGGLMGDDVVGQAGKHNFSRHILPGHSRCRGEVTEKQGLFAGAVVSVGLP